MMPEPVKREIIFTFGPRFFVENGETMFAFRIDGTNEIGPRTATQADAEKHPDAFAAFMSQQGAEAEGTTEPILFVPDKKRRGRPPKSG